MYSSAGFNESSRSWFGFGLNLTTPPVSHTGPAEISFTPDNMAVVVSNKGANPPLFYVPMASGVLGTTSVNSTIFGNVPFGFTWDPTDGSIILTDAAPFVVSGGGVQVIQVNSSMITELLPNFFLLEQNATCWVSRSAMSGYFFGANAASSSVTMFSRSGTNLTILDSFVIDGAASVDNTVVSVGGQDILLQLSGTQQIFVVFVSGGNLSLWQTVSLGTNHTAGIVAYVVGGSTTSTSSTSSSTMTSGVTSSVTTTSSSTNATSSATGSTTSSSNSTSSSSTNSTSASSTNSTGSTTSSSTTSSSTSSSSTSSTSDTSILVISVLLSLFALFLF